MKPDVFTLRAADEQHDKADDLAGYGRQCRSGHAEAEDEDEKRIQKNIENGAGQDADHGVNGTALKAELIVDDKLAGHEGSAYEDDPHVAFRLDKRFRGRAASEELHDRIHENKAENGEQETDQEGNGKACGRHLVGLCLLSGAQHARQVVA